MRREVSLSLARFVAIMVPASLLLGAIGSQYIGGLFPCEMCMWQRWPHLAAIGAALGAIALRDNPPMSATFTMLSAFALATTGMIGAFHAGVEYGWWQGITSCASAANSDDGVSLLDSIMQAQLVRCDVAPWQMFGISLAGYNAIISLGGALLTALLVRKWSRS